MSGSINIAGRGKYRTVSSRIKNPGLVREKHLLIAKKASKLFIKKGYNQTTMREISNSTGMAIGNLYGYVSKKEDILCLVFAVYQQYIEDYLDSHRASVVTDPKESLRLFVRNFLKITKDFKDEIVFMCRESRFLPKENLARATNKEIELIHKVEQIIQKGINQGVFSFKEPYFAASMIISQLNSLALKSWALRGKYSSEEVDSLIEESILKSISC
jgi:AcrR family transcriptional regulator